MCLLTVAIIIFVSYSTSYCNFASFQFVVLVYPACGKHGDLMVSVLISGSCSLDLSPGWGHLSPSTQVYKWVMVNVMLGVTLWWTSIRSRAGWWGWGVGTLLVVSYYWNWDKLWLDGPFCSYVNITYFTFYPALMTIYIINSSMCSISHFSCSTKEHNSICQRQSLASL